MAASSYALTARATDNLGARTTSSTVNITVTDPVGPPSPPANLTATAGDRSVSLAWSASSGATSYKVKRSTTSGSGYTVVAPSVASTSYTDSGLTNGTRYYYVVTAANGSGESGNSNEASAVPNVAGTQIIFDGSCGTVIPGDVSIGCNPNYEVPGLVFDNYLQVIFAAGDTVSVRLFNVDDYEYVFVNAVLRATAYYAQDQTFDLTPYMVVGSNTVQLQAYNAGYTPWCYGFTLTKITGGGGAPAAPSSLGASVVSSSQINLSWTDNSTNEQGFKIERKTGAGSFSQIATVGANVTSYPDSSLSSSTSYTYRVRAYNGSGDSNYSNEASATTRQFR